MWQTLKDFQDQIDEYYKINGEYPRELGLSLRVPRPKGFRAYCNRMKIKVNYSQHPRR
jgi:hypothetical protein